MNQNTQIFIEKLKLNPWVVGIILFWSWARGNVRPGSDVDLVVILEEGYSRNVEKEGDQIFEIIYITAEAAFDFWNSHRDDAAWLWEVAKILYDKNGKVNILAEKIKNIILEGKRGFDDAKLGQLRFEAEDSLIYSEYIFPSDSTTAVMLLTNNVAHLIELFFDVRKMWTPAPKQRIRTIHSLRPELYLLIDKFYHGWWDFHERLSLVRKIISVVFEK